MEAREELQGPPLVDDLRWLTGNLMKELLEKGEGKETSRGKEGLPGLLVVSSRRFWDLDLAREDQDSLNGH